MMLSHVVVHLVANQVEVSQVKSERERNFPSIQLYSIRSVHFSSWINPTSPPSPLTLRKKRSFRSEQGNVVKTFLSENVCKIWRDLCKDTNQLNTSWTYMEWCKRWRLLCLSFHTVCNVCISSVKAFRKLMKSNEKKEKKR